MSLFHAFYSLGGLVGAGAGGLLVEARIDPREHVFGLSAVLAVLGVMFLSRLHSTTTQPSTRGSRWEELRGPVAGLGALAFLVFGSEGAMLDWSAAYLKNSLAAGPGLAAAGYAAFSLMMAVGRLCGDWAVARIGTGRLARSSGWLAAGGTVLAIVAGRPETAIVGFGLVGLGLSNIVPVLFSAAARAPGAPSGPAIAAVATVGYAGLLAAPPAIGFVAEAATLRAGLVLVLAAIVLVSLRIRASVEAELIRSRA